MKPRVPIATYRLQLRAELGFDAAAAQFDYLARLGVTHVYTSPYLQAAAGSTHGYDGVDPTRVSDELGGPEAHRRFVDGLRLHGLGQVVDVVPNHLSIVAGLNRWWWDVLRNGPASRYAGHFDIEWDSPDPELTGKVVIPVLGKSLGEELAAGTIRLTTVEGEDVVEYFDTSLPLAPGSAEDGAPLAEVLARQHWVLAFWRDGLARLTHRRFFDVTSLAGVRVEDDSVFDDVHRSILGWVAAGDVDGLRVDHPDGLADPTGYLHRLAAAAPDAWLVVEKILEPGEELRDDWPVDGTTGYDALNTISGVLIDSSAEPSLTAVYESCTGSRESFDDVARRSRIDVVRGLLAPELDRVTRKLAEVLPVATDRLRPVVAAFVAELPVYRTYVVPGSPVSDADRAAVAAAIARVSTHHPDVDHAVAEQMAATVLERGPDAAAGTQVHEFVRQLQQLSGPAMAKGVEDTAFYRYTRFVAANEVGGDPQHLGTTVDALHEANLRRADGWPTAMVSTSTHDTKRAEDVRARLAVLSEMPEGWGTTLTRWMRRTAGWWRDASPDVPRDPALEVLLHQTLVGAHPLSPDRAHTYLDKAMREAKNITSWIDVDEPYERAAHGLLDRLLTDAEHRRELDALLASVLVPGRINALTQKLLALTAPGVPDVYQGTELWTLDLVDPDNRRPVDYGVRRAMLDLLDDPSTDVPATLADPHDAGIAKLLVTRGALAVRRRRTAAFAGKRACYAPLRAEGAAERHVIAYVRGGDVVVVAPRLPLRLDAEGGWRDTRLRVPDGEWTDVLSGLTHRGGDVELADLTARFPVVLLERA